MRSFRLPIVSALLVLFATLFAASVARGADPATYAVFLFDGKLPDQVALEALVRKLAEPHPEKVALRTLHAGRAETVPFLKKHGFTRKNAPLLLLMDLPGDDARIVRKVYVDPSKGESTTARLVTNALKLPKPKLEHPKPGPVVTIKADGGAEEQKLLTSAAGSQRLAGGGRWLDGNGVLTYRITLPDELRYADLNVEIGGNFAVDWTDGPRGRWTPLMDQYGYFGPASEAITTRVSPIAKLDDLLDKLQGQLYLRVRTNGRGRNSAFVGRLELVSRAPGVDSAEATWLKFAEGLRNEEVKKLFPGVDKYTPVGGTLIANQTWTVNNSPYLLSGDLTVGPSTTLTIEPGVTVRAAPNAAIRVRGQLVAKGTTTEPIVFASGAPKQPDDWKGIYFPLHPARPSGAASSLQYCRISNAANTDLQQFSGEITHSTFTSCLVGITVRGGGTGRVHHNRFKDCQTGLSVDGGAGEVVENLWEDCRFSTAFKNLVEVSSLRFEQNSLVRSQLAAVNYLKVPGRTLPTLNLPSNHWDATPPEKLIGGGKDAGPVNLEPKLPTAPAGVGPG